MTFNGSWIAFQTVGNVFAVTSFSGALLKLNVCVDFPQEPYNKNKKLMKPKIKHLTIMES